jgi:MFS family permease
MEAIGSERPGVPLIPAEAELRGFGRRGGGSTSYIRILLEAVSVLVDQRFCRFEIGRLEPLGKLAINRREQLTCLFGPLLVAPQTGEIGTITTIYVIAYTLGTLLGGTFADYLGRRSVLSFSVLLYMFVDALTAVANGFWSLSFFRLITGTGTGMELPVGSTFITEAVNNRRRARLNSIMNAGYPAGYAAAIGAFATIGAVWGWRGVFVASIIPGIIVFFVRLKVSESPRFQEAQERLARGEVRRDRVTNITVFRKPYARDALPAVLYWIS